MYTISVIIPVYNAEKYLKKAIDSVLSQTLARIELVCINDGSKDGSMRILSEYQKNYSNNNSEKGKSTKDINVDKNINDFRKGKSR